ncbi:MAG: hypothetical protein ACKO8I_01455 [Cyanobacteriota bacterium]
MGLPPRAAWGPGAVAPHRPAGGLQRLIAHVQPKKAPAGGGGFATVAAALAGSGRG